MNTLPDPNTFLLRRFSKEQMRQYELIMTADQDGETIFYYAIPKEDNPKDFEVRAFSKEWINKETDEYEMKDLTTKKTKKDN